MRAIGQDKCVYISDNDVYLTEYEGGYKVHNKYTDECFGEADMADVPGFMRLRIGVRTWGEHNEKADNL